MRAVLATACLAATLIAGCATTGAPAYDQPINPSPTVVPSADGLVIHGEHYLDPEGTINDFAVGNDAVTYLVDRGGGKAALKRVLIGQASPAVLGSLELYHDGVVFTGSDGASASGLMAKPIDGGLILMRAGSVVVIEPGAEAKPVALPTGYHPALYQNGDVAGTGFLLLERHQPIQSRPEELLRTSVEIARTLVGASENSYDYALFGLETGALVPININTDRNETGFGFGCVRRSTVTSQCLGWVSYDAVYLDDGRPNWSHYYWSLDWRNTRYGPMAVAIENGLTKLNAIRLTDGARATAFRRGMGIQYFTLDALADGDLVIVGHWSFRPHPVSLSALVAQERFAAE